MNHLIQWGMCSLHFNEFFLRHSFIHVDNTKAQQNLQIILGKELRGVIAECSFAQFRSILSQHFPEVPPQAGDNLKRDQHNSSRICKAVMTGSVENDL